VVVAIRENEARAASLGYDTRFYKTLLFTIGGGIAGLAGILFASWGRFINPDCFGQAFASSVVVFVILGGRTHLLGGFVGALLIGYLTNYLGETLPFPAMPQDAPLLLTVAMEASNRIIKEAPILAQGAVLVVMVLVLQDGLVPHLIRWGQRHLWLCWLLLVPLVVAFYGVQVLCRQAEICLWSGN
jgi:branched-chain amino acid transport system permease protein